MEHIKMNVGKNEASMHIYLNGLDVSGHNKVPRPAILIFPGGSYECCSPWEDEPIAMAFMAEGYQAFTLYYSVSRDPQKQVYPDVLEDAEDALRNIRAHAKEWNIDPKRVAVIGFSAGGHLAAYLSSAGKEKPNATILAYPRTTGSKPEEERYIPDAIDAIDRNTPPAFIFGTREDEAVGPIHGMRYAEKLQKHHILYEIHYFENGPHGMTLGKSWSANGYEGALNPAYSRWFPMCIDWLKLHFGDFMVRRHENYVNTKSKAMDMPLEYLLENDNMKNLLFEKVSLLEQAAQNDPVVLADFTINRLARFLGNDLTKEIMKDLDMQFYKLEEEQG